MSEEKKTREGSTSPIDALLELAFEKGPGLEANQLIQAVRRKVQKAHGRAFNYEVSLLNRSWEQMVATEGPKLVRYLRAMGFYTKRCDPVFVSLFYGDEVFFIRAAEFRDLLQRLRIKAALASDDAMLPVPVARVDRDRDE